MLWVIAAGFSGAFIGMNKRKNTRTFLQRVIYLFSGSLVEFWLSPFLCKQFNFFDPEELSAVAFMSGLFWSGIVYRLRKIIDTISLFSQGNKK
jgi:hypothetical protein